MENVNDEVRKHTYSKLEGSVREVVTNYFKSIPPNSLVYQWPYMSDGMRVAIDKVIKDSISKMNIVT